MTTTERASATLTAAFFAPDARSRQGSRRNRRRHRARTCAGSGAAARPRGSRPRRPRRGLERVAPRGVGLDARARAREDAVAVLAGRVVLAGIAADHPGAHHSTPGAPRRCCWTAASACACRGRSRGRCGQGGRQAATLSSGSADVGLRTAALLAELKLPATLAPAVVAYAMQDVIDFAEPAFFDDWPAFQRDGARSAARADDGLRLGHCRRRRAHSASRPPQSRH